MFGAASSGWRRRRHAVRQHHRLERLAEQSHSRFLATLIPEPAAAPGFRLWVDGRSTDCDDAQLTTLLFVLGADEQLAIRQRLMGGTPFRVAGRTVRIEALPA
ncbi:hypothetical protein [Jeongeupia naejangsanensis]|uniref:Uncharacterized protein n=1 Tax=Jeongeupia naejangsanensis TaxID=613195 RepID=A0ABS2BJE8_9NEIS|nr:hypothetical protein [Jeongeupia naejangsanensis]MBM3115743.1 hypothetical protein [Jeongeupia naejangsanensis]